MRVGKIFLKCAQPAISFPPHALQRQGAALGEAGSQGYLVALATIQGEQEYDTYEIKFILRGNESTVRVIEL
jgi:hypothetical protein